MKRPSSHMPLRLKAARAPRWQSSNQVCGRKRGFRLGPDRFSALPGYGVEASFEGTHILAGSKRLMSERKVDTTESDNKVDELALQGKTIMYIAVNGRNAGILAVADTIREGSAGAVAKMKEMGLEVIMITGDSLQTANHIAAEAGIEKVVAGVLPGIRPGNQKNHRQRKECYHGWRRNQ
ncbi:MAG: HAD family hydrolase [Bacteroidales bacterium]